MCAFCKLDILSDIYLYDVTENNSINGNNNNNNYNNGNNETPNKNLLATLLYCIELKNQLMI